MGFSLESLEFSRLVELVGRNAQTPMGVARFARLRPISTRSALDHDLRAIGETVMLSVSAFPIDQHRTEFTGTAQADGNGQVKFPNFSIDRSHIGARFLATATGSESSTSSSNRA